VRLEGLFAECLHQWLCIYLHLAAGAKSSGERGALQAVSELSAEGPASSHGDRSRANWHRC